MLGLCDFLKTKSLGQVTGRVLSPASVMGMIQTMAAALVGNPAGQVTVGGVAERRNSRLQLERASPPFDSVSLFLGIRCEPAWTSQSLKLALPWGCRVNAGPTLILSPH